MMAGPRHALILRSNPKFLTLTARRLGLHVACGLLNGTITGDLGGHFCCLKVPFFGKKCSPYYLLHNK